MPVAAAGADGAPTGADGVPSGSGADGAPSGALAGTAANGSFAQRASVAASGNARTAGCVNVTPAGTSPVGVDVVMVLTDLDLIEQTDRIVITSGNAWLVCRDARQLRSREDGIRSNPVPHLNLTRASTPAVSG